MARSEISEAPCPVGKTANDHPFLLVLAFLTVANLAFFAIGFSRTLANRDGFLIDSVSPFGGDFINLWTTGKLLLAGAIGTIYDPTAFMAFQNSFVHAGIGLRLWAYPPQSLLLVWPFGFFGYFTSFAVWSPFGLVFLAWCARRFGFGWKEVLVLVLSPAALSCIINGQTGNFFAGLMLLALAPRSRADPYSIVGAALLTIKPQTGFLLPLVWAFQRRWLAIAITAAIALSMLAVSILIFGTQAWSDYLYLTVPELSALEQFGTGPFTRMIPSLFMSLRLLGMSGDSALAVHLVFACIVAVILAWRLSRTTDHRAQSALILIGTCLITPYVHVYDLSLLLAGGLLILRTKSGRLDARFYLTAGAALVTWLMPVLLPKLATGGTPVAPLLLLIVFFTIREPVRPVASPASASD